MKFSHEFRSVVSREKTSVMSEKESKREDEIWKLTNHTRAEQARAQDAEVRRREILHEHIVIVLISPLHLAYSHTHTHAQEHTHTPTDRQTCKFVSKHEHTDSYLSKTFANTLSHSL